MCQKAVCDTCGEYCFINSPLERTSSPGGTDSAAAGNSWWGCGKHVTTVLEATPSSKWCTCDPRIERGGKQYPPMAKQPGAIIRNAAAVVLWMKGKRAGWSAEGVIEEPLTKEG